MLSSIADGFTLHPGMIEIPGRYEPMAIAQLELIRKSATYRPYWVRLPEVGDVIRAFGTYSYQVHLKPGSWLCGLQITVMDLADTVGDLEMMPSGGEEEEGSGMPTNAPVLSLQITETFSGAQLFSEHSLTPPLCNHAFFGDTSRLQFFLLSEPKVIIDPGDLDVEVCNLTDMDRQWQLLLLTAEPYEVVLPLTEAER